MRYTNSDIVPAAIRGENANTYNGNLWTGHYRPEFPRYGAPYFGYLPRRLADILNQRFKDGAISQVVYSYGTPIAWKDGETWIIPEVTYSATTSSKHQSQLYRLRGEYIPWDAGMDEYVQVLNGRTRYAYHDAGARKRTYRGE